MIECIDQLDFVDVNKLKNKKGTMSALHYKPGNSSSKIHELKLNNKYFDAVLNRKKNFELRKNDRGFKESDRLLLKEVLDDGTYTGREVMRSISYILEGPCYGLQEGYCILSID